MSTERTNESASVPVETDPVEIPAAAPAEAEAPESKPESEPQAPAEEEDCRVRYRRARLKIIGFLALLIFVYLIPDIFYSVYPGHAAVIWYRFAGGTDVDDVRGEGLRVKWPWDRVYLYNIRMQYETRDFNALCSDGLPIKVETTLRFRLHMDALGELHKHVGPDYLETLVMPELGAHVRERISQYRPAALYTQQREQIQNQILSQMKAELLLSYDEGREVEQAIFVEDVLIRDIVLPPKVASAIDDKLAQEQRMLEYEYRLEKERRERDRKAIEAEGIRIFQDTVTGGISEPYLKWKGIDATLELARSPNAKIVIIGAGKDGLPIILGGIDSLPSVPLQTGSSAGPAATGPSSAAPPASTAPPMELPG